MNGNADKSRKLARLVNTLNALGLCAPHTTNDVEADLKSVEEVFYRDVLTKGASDGPNARALLAFHRAVRGRNR